MINKEKFLEIMQIVITENFPDEISAFEEEGESYIDDLYENKDIKKTFASEGENKFIIDPIETLKFISLLCGTFVSVKKFYDEFYPKENVDLDYNTLKELLIKNKVKSKIADKIITEIKQKIK